jgi:hypothetical protein
MVLLLSLTGCNVAAMLSLPSFPLATTSGPDGEEGTEARCHMPRPWTGLSHRYGDLEGDGKGCPDVLPNETTPFC